MAATAPSDSPIELADRLAKDIKERPANAPADAVTHELQADATLMQAKTPQERKAFYARLSVDTAAEPAAQHLPGLEITYNKSGQLLVKDQGKLVYDESKDSPGPSSTTRTETTSANGYTIVREQEANGDYAEWTSKGDDRTVTTHRIDPGGGYTDRAINSLGLAFVDTYDKDGHEIYAKHEYGSHDFVEKTPDRTVEQINLGNGRYRNIITDNHGRTQVTVEPVPGGGVNVTTNNPDGSTAVFKEDANGNSTSRTIKGNAVREIRYDKESDTYETKLYKSDKLTYDRKDYPDGGYRSESYADDGTVTIHNELANGSFNEITMKGTDVSVKSHTPTEQGGFTEVTHNSDGSVTNHNENKDGTFVETTHYLDGHETTTTKTREEMPGGGFVDTTTAPDGRIFHIQMSNGDTIDIKTNAKGEEVLPRVETVGASSTFARAVKDGIAKLPPAVLALLAKDGAQYIITNNLDQVMGEAAREHPRGHPADETWSNLAGGEDPLTKSIEIAAPRLESEEQIEGLVGHETGHAVDHALGGFSHLPEFDQAYNADVALLTDEQKTRYHYFLQPGFPGKEETFAEVFGALVEHETSGGELASDLLGSFPNVAALIRQRLQQLEQPQ